jgi:hypothetical protein
MVQVERLQGNGRNRIMALHYLALEFGSRIPKHGIGVIVTRTWRVFVDTCTFLLPGADSLTAN